jgi:hypothetical protein
VQPDQPIVGCYLMRLVRHGVMVPVRIWFGPSFDPASGEWCDRSHRWRACIDGEQIDIWQAWPACSGCPISAAEYAFRRCRSAHMRAHEPHMPEANPRRAVDHDMLTFDFGGAR